MRKNRSSRGRSLQNVTLNLPEFSLTMKGQFAIVLAAKQSDELLSF
jgi:hypothetical protein